MYIYVPGAVMYGIFTIFFQNQRKFHQSEPKFMSRGHNTSALKSHTARPLYNLEFCHYQIPPSLEQNIWSHWVWVLSH